jgi:glycosyltransferase involved in cell wall biosynthesis
MRIAYVTSSLVGGGGPLPIPAVTRVLRNAGAHVEVFALTRRDGRALPAMLADGLTVHIREGGDYDHLEAYRWLDKKIAEYKPTLIWTSVARASIIGLLLGRKFTIPVVCWQHSAALKFSRHFMFYLLRKWPVMWVGDSDVVSTITAKRFNVPKQKMATWPLFSFNPNAPQAKPWKQGQVLRLGSLGRLDPPKGYDKLIDALEVLKKRGFTAPVKFEILIAGDGGDRDKILQKAKIAGVADQVHLLGFTDKPQDFLASLHVYFQPSRIEGFCIALHEAMQAGLPVISTAVGQIPFTVESGRSGWLVPPLDVTALADTLADALSHPEKLAAMGQAAKARVFPRYSVEAFKNAGESILNRLRLQGIIK